MFIYINSGNKVERGAGVSGPSILCELGSSFDGWSSGVIMVKVSVVAQEARGLITGLTDMLLFFK